MCRCNRPDMIGVWWARRRPYIHGHTSPDLSRGFSEGFMSRNLQENPQAAVEFLDRDKRYNTPFLFGLRGAASIHLIPVQPPQCTPPLKIYGTNGILVPTLLR